MDLTEEQITFLKGMDFMKLGQAVNHGQWQAAAMTVRRMENEIRQNGLTELQRNLMGISQAIRCKNQNQAKQILSQLVAKRVQMLKGIS